MNELQRPLAHERRYPAPCLVIGLIANIVLVGLLLYYGLRSRANEPEQPWDFQQIYSEMHHPLVMQPGDAIPYSKGLYFEGWHQNDARALEVAVTDMPFSRSNFKIDQQRRYNNTFTSNLASSKISNSTSLRPQRRSHDLPNYTGWDHCTIWPLAPSMSGCHNEAGLSEIYHNAGYDHTRALILFLLDVSFGPVPKALEAWPAEFSGTCVKYNDARVCVSWPFWERPPNEGCPISAVNKRQILDNTMPCAQEGKSAQHEIVYIGLFKTICVSTRWDNCDPQNMGCHFDAWVKGVKKCWEKHGDSYALIPDPEGEGLP